jgi:methyl-accepting chemotaxis protein
MRLMGQFNLIFVLVLGLAVGVDYVVFNSFFQASAQKEVLEHAKLMLETSMSIRKYTTAQIDPVIKSLDPKDRHFYPQTVPSYAAVENFNYLRATNPEYTYREATLNPTNPRDRATDWEADIINLFRNDPSQKEFSRIRRSATGPSLVLAKPIVAGAPCLACHSTPQAAPTSIIRQYGSSNGFGWQLNEVVGAQVVSVPMALPVAAANQALRSSMISLVLIAVLTLIVLNITLAFFVIKPVYRLAVRADEISKGNLEVPELPVSGHNEISVLAASFNRMHRSLKSALRLLGQNEK